MQQGRREMGSHKHGVSGVAPKNRRALRQFAMKLNREAKEAPPKKKSKMYNNIQQLWKERGTP